MLEGIMTSVKWKLPRDRLLWIPRFLLPGNDDDDTHSRRCIKDYLLLAAVFLRVNGSQSLLEKRRMVFGTSAAAQKTDVVGIKIGEFIDRHAPLVAALDSMDDPSDINFSASGLSLRELSPSGGKTQFMEDRDLIRVEVTTVKSAPGPLDIIRTNGVTKKYDLPEFEVPVDVALGTWSYRIKHVMSDAELESWFVLPVDREANLYRAFPYYYPVPMKTAAVCRAHSWYLACLLMINRSWTEVISRKPVEGEDEDDDYSQDDYAEQEEDITYLLKSVGKDPAVRPVTEFISGRSQKDPKPWLNVNFKHSLKVRHAFHCYMGSFVNLFYAAISTGRISDESWTSNLDNRPSLLDKFFPYDTAGFHWGDLPSVSSVLEDVGLTGVQVVKNKIPIVRILMKCLPVCCQSRDLVGQFLVDCKDIDGEGYWRVVRAIFFCSLAGLYPGSEHRASFRSMLRLRHMLYEDRSVFFAALEKEELDNKNLPGNKKLNRTCNIITIVFREFFVYMSSVNSEWVQLVNAHIKWEKFVVNTLGSADEMRKCARFADAPAGDELLYAANALVRAKTIFKGEVYRFKKRPYIQTMLDAFNAKQDSLHEAFIVKKAEIRRLQKLQLSLVEKGYLSESDLEPMKETIHMKSFRGDPSEFYRANSDDFVRVMDALLNQDCEHFAHLSIEIDPDIKVNIMHYLLRCSRSEWLKFDNLLDPRLGGVSKESVQSMYRTQKIYETRASPKSIDEQLSNLQVRDIRVFSWYFNFVARLSQFKVTPLDQDMVDRQAVAMRIHRFRLLPDEPLPPMAWTVYICFCCSRIATFSNGMAFGNNKMTYDPELRAYVCGKKPNRSTRSRFKPSLNPSFVNNEAEKKKIADASRKKKARGDRKDDNVIPCGGQPVVAIELYGKALEFKDKRYLFCPSCSQFHVYWPMGYGRDGYKCSVCRGKELPLSKMERCAFCEGSDRGHTLNVVEIIAGTTDPCNPDHDADNNPLQCYQTLHLCRKDANSAGVFDKHYASRVYAHVTKEKLWKIIPVVNHERKMENIRKFKH